jgi:predicted secreted protein
MAKLHGKEAFIFNGAQKIASVTDISLDVENKQVDATDHDSLGWEECIGGNKTWSGTWSNIKVLGDASQDALFSALTGATLITVNIYPKGNVSTNPVFSGTALVTKYSYKAPNAAIQTIDITFQGSAALTEGVVP